MIMKCNNLLQIMSLFVKCGHLQKVNVVASIFCQ